MRSVRTRLGVDLRAHWRSTVALALMIGVAGGAVLATTAGARRTDTAYPRFLESSRAEDVVIGGVDLSPEAFELFGRLKRLPQVAAAAPEAAMIIFAEGSDLSESHRTYARGLDTPYHFAGTDLNLGTTVSRAKVIAGRVPDPTSADEVLVNRAMARRLHLRVGSEFRGVGYNGQAIDTGGDDPPPAAPVRLKVVGVGVFPSDVVPTADYDTLPIFYLPNGYYRAHPTLTQSYAFWLFRLKRGERDVAAFQAATNRVLRAAGVPPSAVIVDSQGGRAAKVGRAIHPQALALEGFALLTGLASLLVIGQALTRQLASDALDYPTLRALGMTPRDLAAMALLRVALIASAGALVAVAVAVAVSPLMPIGPARVAEPHPGVEINVAVLAIGLGAIVVALLARAAWPAWRAASARPGVLGPPEVGGEHPSRIANRLAGTGLPAAASLGARMALESGRGRTSVPVRSALLGTAVAVAAVAGAFTFNTNLDRLVSTPHLYGWDWDIAAGVGFFSLPKDVSDALLEHPGVDGVAGAQLSSVTVDGRDEPVLGIDQLGGAPVFPTLLEGRAPNGPHEIALGAKTLRRAHRGMGDKVVIGIGDRKRTMRIVGRVVFPKFGGAGFSSTGLGEGAALSAHLLGPVDRPDEFHSVALIRFKPGVDRARTLRGVLPIINSGRFLGCPSALCVTNARTQRPGDLENYARVRRTPLVLAALLAAMAFAALANTLVSSIRRRRRDLAILKTLGFLRHQVSATTAWQATTLAVAALLVGLPLGVAAGRAAWLAFAHQLGVAENARTPVVAVLLAVPATVALANLVAAVPALSAARTRPARVLRTE